MSSTQPPFGENHVASPKTAHPNNETSSLVPKAKKMKKEPSKVFTFALSHSPVQVQLLQSHTIYNLVDIICQETTVGIDESVDEHMWDVYVPGMPGSFNSSDEYIDITMNGPYRYGYSSEEPLRSATRAKLGDLDLTIETEMILKYDYGTTSYYKITLVEIEETDQEELFPRQKPLNRATSFYEFHTSETDLDDMFPKMNTFLSKAEMLTIDLFQPGRKKNHGYLERNNMNCMHMIFLPAKAGNDLSDYLHTIDYACQFDVSMYDAYCPNYSWYSMVVFPCEHNKKFGPYGRNLEPGFCDMKQATANSKPKLNTVFPKVAALAGYKKDKKVPKGWIRYKDNILLICSGSAQPTHCKAPPGTAFYGENQHNPASPNDILLQTKIEIKSLHHLFCVTEGMLRTL